MQRPTRNGDEYVVRVDVRVTADAERRGNADDANEKAKKEDLLFGPGTLEAIKKLAVGADDFEGAAGHAGVSLRPVDVARTLAANHNYQRALSWLLIAAFAGFAATDFLSTSVRSWSLVIVLLETATVYLREDLIDVSGTLRHVPRTKYNIFGRYISGTSEDKVLINAVPRLHTRSAARLFLGLLKVFAFVCMEAHSAGTSRCAESSSGCFECTTDSETGYCKRVDFWPQPKQPGEDPVTCTRTLVYVGPRENRYPYPFVQFCAEPYSTDAFVAFFAMMFVLKATHTLVTNMWWLLFFRPVSEHAAQKTCAEGKPQPWLWPELRFMRLRIYVLYVMTMTSNETDGRLVNYTGMSSTLNGAAAAPLKAQLLAIAADEPEFKHLLGSALPRYKKSANQGAGMSCAPSGNSCTPGCVARGVPLVLFALAVFLIGNVLAMLLINPRTGYEIWTELEPSGNLRLTTFMPFPMRPKNMEHAVLIGSLLALCSHAAIVFVSSIGSCRGLRSGGQWALLGSFLFGLPFTCFESKLTAREKPDPSLVDDGRSTEARAARPAAPNPNDQNP